MSTGGLIGVTGATGGLGGRVARRLAGRGVAQRLVVREAARAPELDGAEVAVATYGDAEAMRRALDGVATLLLVSASEDPDRVRLHTTAVDAAVAAGVERVVYTSFFGAAPDCTFTFGRDHWYAEELSRFAGRPITYQEETIEEAYASRASYGAPDWDVDGWVSTYTAIANGDLERVSGDLAALAGHPPMRLAEFLRDHPDSYRHLAGPPGPHAG